MDEVGATQHEICSGKRRQAKINIVKVPQPADLDSVTVPLFVSKFQITVRRASLSALTSKDQAESAEL